MVTPLADDAGVVLDPLDTDGISQALQAHGFCVIRQLFPTATVERARAHLEAAVERHLSSAVAAGAIDRMPEELPLEERIAAAYAHAPENAPASWVSAIRTAPAFHHHLFRDAALCSVVKRLTGREPCVAARYNCRCKLKAAAGAAFPWHQDHAFFRMQYALRGEAPRRLLAAWAPLTEVGATNGGVQLSPGSHRAGFVPHRREGGFLTAARGAFAANSGGPAAAAPEAVLPALSPGDVLLFSDLTMHRSAVSCASTARWSADWAYELKEGDTVCPPLGLGAVTTEAVAVAAAGEAAAAGVAVAAAEPTAPAGQQRPNRGVRAAAPPEERLDPPRVCCGREFTLRRALASHVRNHVSCGQCAFEGCLAALKLHEWRAHGVGGPPATTALPAGAAATYTVGRAGGAFEVREEVEAVVAPLEERYPGAEIVWSIEDHATGDAAAAVASAQALSPPKWQVEGEGEMELGAAVQWPAGCRVLLLVGVAGSGKSRLLRALAAAAAGDGGDGGLVDARYVWPANRSILDVLGTDGHRWLAAVGLGSVPLWCQPYAALSTGEAFRAELARRLQLAAASDVPLLTVDGFCNHLDPLSAACCAASLSRHLRREGRGTRAVVASCHPRVAHWLRPDAVVVCRPGRSATVLRIADAHALLPLRINVLDDGAAPLSTAGAFGEEGDAEAKAPGGGGEAFVHALRRCGLRVVSEACFDDAPPFQPDAHMPPPTGGRVLASRVERTAATRSVESFFDLPHDGTCARRLPPFPSEAQLGGARLGLVCGDAPHLLAPARQLATHPRPSGLGPSGAAKSALLAAHFGPPPPPWPWPRGARLDQVFASEAQAARCLAAVAAPLPAALAWSGGECSAGEAAQAELALALAASEPPAEGGEGSRSGGGSGSALRPCVFDEFGSAWDEATATRVGGALTRAVRSAGWAGGRVVLAGCHVSHVGPGGFEPDWVFEAASAILFRFAPRAAPDCSALVPVQAREGAGGTAAMGAAEAAEVGGASMTAAGDDSVVDYPGGLTAWEDIAHARSGAVSCDGYGPLCDSGFVRLAPPRFALRLRRCEPAAWRRFHAFHYKTPLLSRVATCFLLEATLWGHSPRLAAQERSCHQRASSEQHPVDDVSGLAAPTHETEAAVRLPVGFVATIPHSGRRSEWARAPAQRAHRTVVLPEWQGLGIGARLSDAVAEWHRRRGSDYFGQTVHPRFGGYRDASPLWEGTDANHSTPELRWLPRRLTGAGGQRAVAIKRQQPRMVYAHAYVGAAAGEPARRHLEERVRFVEVDGLELIEDDECASALRRADRDSLHL